MLKRISNLGNGLFCTTLFVKLIESNKTENKEIKLTPDMLNLLGCNKENFLKLIELMDYKHFNKKEESE